VVVVALPRERIAAGFGVAVLGGSARSSWPSACRRSTTRPHGGRRGRARRLLRHAVSRPAARGRTRSADPARTAGSGHAAAPNAGSPRRPRARGVGAWPADAPDAARARRRDAADRAGPAARHPRRGLGYAPFPASGHGWDQANIVTWNWLEQRSALRVRDFFFPYGCTWTFSVHPLGPVWNWLYELVVLGLFAW